ncbi:type I restriction-modification system, specificity subunit [Corynebacterium renale]|uniref:restriction endonuclease subunit S n=1 Tax=Corynebacterium renale TaxID=1724 RepID=UPI000DA2D9E0|nr:restriction endonuclease subunit S [Corynebacterium renale]SQG63373.1 type I restriction-modification system, specificity subunit [Corynebacterium renale]STC99798.1 type I restriction-modification system, specificity subunit [Corynebacterium renale]
MAWEMVELGEILEQQKDSVYVSDPLKAKLISVQLYGKGAVRRKTTPEKAPSPFKGFRGRADQIVYSRIWARRGAVAVIPPELDGVVVTNEFPLFNANAKHLDTAYFSALTRSDLLAQQLELAADGTSGQNRVKVDRFLEIKIPLPPLAEQRRIAMILDEAQSAVSEQQQSCDSLISLEANIAQQSLMHAEKTLPLEELADLQGGLTLNKKRASNPIEVDYLRVGNVQRGELELDLVKTIRCTEKEVERCALQKGDILIVEANANPFEVGRAAQVPDLENTTVYQNHLFRARPHDDVDANYLEQAINSWDVRRQLAGLAKTTSGLNGFSISQARRLKVPALGTHGQQKLSAAVEQIRLVQKQNTGKLHLLQELYSSLSARAFAREL